MIFVGKGNLTRSILVIVSVVSVTLQQGVVYYVDAFVVAPQVYVSQNGARKSDAPCDSYYGRVVPLMMHPGNSSSSFPSAFNSNIQASAVVVPSNGLVQKKQQRQKHIPKQPLRQQHRTTGDIGFRSSNVAKNNNKKIDSHSVANNIADEFRSVGSTTTTTAAAQEDAIPTTQQRDKGPYADLSEEELVFLTDQLLSHNSSLHMTPKQLHEGTRLMSSWSKRKVEESGLWTERLFTIILRQKEMGNEAASLTPIMYNMAISAWLNCGHRTNVLRACRIFEQMIILYEKKHSKGNPIPNTAIANVVIESMVKFHPGKESALRCEAILSKMIELNEQQQQHQQHRDVRTPTTEEDELYFSTLTIQPNTRTYNGVMNAWAQARDKTSGEQAEQILLKMREDYNNNSCDENFFSGSCAAQPNRKSFNIAIHAWAKSGAASAAGHAERILKMMELDFLSGRNVDVEPDNISYTSVLAAWANSARKGQRHAVDKAERILDRMEWLHEEGNSQVVHPDTISYNAVLNVYAKSQERDARERCEALFQKMRRMYDNGNDTVKPDLVSYNSVINVIAANAGTNGAARRAGEILEQMEDMYFQGDKSVKPDIYTYNSVIKAYSNSGELTAAQMAESILQRMEGEGADKVIGVSPDAYTYNTVIHSWANSGDIFAAQRAETLLQQMAFKYVEGNKLVKPTAVSYNSVLNALSKSEDPDAPERSTRILQIMVNMYSDGDEAVKPDSFSFSTVINTWSKSKKLEKAQTAVKLLRQMEEFSQPNVFVYSAVLNACAYTFGSEQNKEEALSIAVRILGELQKCEHCNPNHVTYATFLKACAILLPKKDVRRKSLVEHVWRQCIRDGQVGPATLKQLERAAPPTLYMDLLGDYYHNNSNNKRGGDAENNFVSINDLPESWKRNVREKRYRGFTRKYGFKGNNKR